jgi:hypothetical protein
MKMAELIMPVIRGGKYPQRKANRESPQFVLVTGGSFVPLRTPEYEVPGTDCRQSFEGGFRSGGCGRDHDTIGAPAYTYFIAGALSCFCSVLHTFKKGVLHTSELCKRELYGCHPDCHDVSMPHNKSKTPSNDATRVSVRKEMAKPRVARSAKIAELNLDISRIPEQPSTTMPGIVSKIIPSRNMSQPEKAQIAVNGTDQRYRNLRIENTLTDEHGDDLKLKKGAHVDITVTAKAD